MLGTFLGLALGRRRFRGSGSVTLLLFANIAAPEIVLGAALLSLFLTLGVPRGYWTIVIAHVMFSLAYVAVTVRARMAGHGSVAGGGVARPRAPARCRRSSASRCR